MKLLFISNFLNHHQLPICNEFYQILGDDFKFVACEKVPEDKVSLGYNKDFNAPYLVDGTIKNNVFKLLDDYDVLISGSCPKVYTDYFIKIKKPLFVYSERLFKDGTWHKYSPLARYNMNKIYNKHFHKNMYLLCASAYTASDYNDFNSFKDHYLKWGYFPEIANKSYDELIKMKSFNSIIWVGRLIGWKHPEQAILLAKFLNDKNIEFKIEIIGEGPLKNKLHSLIKKYALEEKVKIIGALPFNKVRLKMEQSEIFISTSDFNEGWGAVLNEAMAEGCACVASYKAGSTLFLINNTNGTIYDGTQNDLNLKVFEYLTNKNKKVLHAKNAFNTIVNLWNYKKAAKNLLDFANNILNNNVIYPDKGPISKAKIITNKSAKKYLPNQSE